MKVQVLFEESCLGKILMLAYLKLRLIPKFSSKYSVKFKQNISNYTLFYLFNFLFKITFFLTAYSTKMDNFPLTAYNKILGKF